MAQTRALTSQPRRGTPRSPKSGCLTVLISGTLTILCLLLLGLAVVPVVSPSLGADTADLLRAVVGPAPVAALESFSYRLQDAFNQFRSQVDGGQPQIEWSNQAQVQIPLTSIPPTLPSTRLPDTPQVTPTPLVEIPQTPTPAPPVKDVVADPPQIDWQAYGPVENGHPIMARAMQLSDPKRSYTGVALVRMDMSDLELHLMPGTIEPAHPSGIGSVIPYLGMVPPVYQSNLIAAFNGGFKGIHGRFGMMANEYSLLPPIDGLATVAIYQDGHIAMGAWGTELHQTPDMIAFRQNCPPLIDTGQINPGLYLDNRKAWGYTGNSDITWRTGLGISQDGGYLIYAVGNGTSAATLAEALQKAGAYNAMQLDINQFYAHFYIYQPASDPTQGLLMVGQRLLEEMVNNPHLYLTPNPRDFFFLTLR